MHVHVCMCVYAYAYVCACVCVLEYIGVSLFSHVFFFLAILFFLAYYVQYFAPSCNTIGRLFSRAIYFVNGTKKGARGNYFHE